MPRPRYNRPRMVTTTIRIPLSLVNELDKLIEKGIFRSRSEAIRHAVLQLLAYYRAREQEGS